MLCRLSSSGAVMVARHLENAEPVLVHCSDGWDRTSQICALSQLMLDPYYRSLNGFRVLVEKVRGRQQTPIGEGELWWDIVGMVVFLSRTVVHIYVLSYML